MKYTSCSAKNGTFIDLKLECSRCGYSVYSNDNFCPHCGKELQSLCNRIPIACIVDILNERFRPTKAKDATEDIKPKTDKAENAIEMLDRVHNWLGELIRDGKCDEHCTQCIGASDLADDIWNVLHPENNNGKKSVQCPRALDWEREGIF